VPTGASASASGEHVTEDLAYTVTVERGGVFSTFNNNTGAQPEFEFQSTPLTYDPTNQFGNPNHQYVPNMKS